jgi:hypothetical protein
MNCFSATFIFLFLVISSILPAQTKSPSADSSSTLLPGIWYLQNSYPETADSLVFGREPRWPNNYGDRIEIFGNGDIIDAYSAPCGNDGRLHAIKGSWALDSDTRVLNSTVKIYMKYYTVRILRLTPTALVLLVR